MNIMEKFGWTYEQYLQRPLWFDALYEIKQKAEKEDQERRQKDGQ